nr:reverse transcriptase domain-containing protein [Tanacetum cinerariifolium]
MAIEGGQGHRNKGNQAHGGAFMMGAKEFGQDPNNVTGTFTLNNHYATTLFDYGAVYSFVSTTFIPLLDIEPSDLGFSYEIEIASGKLLEINKVICNCKQEIKGHTFNIDLIPFGHESFDVIVGMDWLSRYKTKIVFHEKRTPGQRFHSTKFVTMESTGIIHQEEGRVKTVSESYYCQYIEVTDAQVEVSAAQELQENILSVYYC